MHPNTSRKSFHHRIAAWIALLGCLACAGLAHAQPVQVKATVTPLGGSFRYEIAVQNNALEDLAIVSLLNGPTGDPLIGSSLTTPTGFLATYDSGLGIVDLLEDISVFPSGLLVDGFSFESLAALGTGFGTFEALSINGTPYSGEVVFEGVPEAPTYLAALLLPGVLLLQVLRRRHPAPGRQP